MIKVTQGQMDIVVLIGAQGGRCIADNKALKDALGVKSITSITANVRALTKKGVLTQECVSGINYYVKQDVTCTLPPLSREDQQTRRRNDVLMTGWSAQKLRRPPTASKKSSAMKTTKTPTTTPQKTRKKATPPSDASCLPVPLQHAIDSLSVTVEAAKKPVVVSNKKVKCEMLARLSAIMDTSIAEQLDEICDVLRQLPDTQEVNQ